MNPKLEHIISLDDLASMSPAREVLLSTSEQELVLACAKGDSVAQKRIYELFAGRMLNICRRYTKSADQAQDLMHDGFIKVFLNIKGFKGQSSLQTWITRIMINNCISHIRKEVKKGFKVNLEVVQLAADSPASFDSDKLRHVSAKDVFKKLNELPLGYRTVFSLYVLDDYSHKEIANQLKISVGTSKSQLSKAKKMLATLLNELK